MPRVPPGVLTESRDQQAERCHHDGIGGGNRDEADERYRQSAP